MMAKVELERRGGDSYWVSRPAPVPPDGLDHLIAMGATIASLLTAVP